MKRNLSSNQCQGLFQQRDEPLAGKQCWQQWPYDGIGIRPVDVLVDRQLCKIMGRMNRKDTEVIDQYFGSEIMHDSVLRQAREMLPIGTKLEPFEGLLDMTGA